MGLLDKFKGEIRRMSHSEEDEDYEEAAFEKIEPSRLSERSERQERPDRGERMERNDRGDRQDRQDRGERMERGDRRERRSGKELKTSDWERDRSRSRVQESTSRPRNGDREFRVDSNIVEFHSRSLHQVLIYEPKTLDDVTVIADYLCRKIPILLKAEQTDPALTTRIVDFISGAAYATEGRVTMISENLFLVTPFTVNLVSEMVDGLENQGIFHKS